MAPAEAGGYRLTPRALADLEAIWRYSAATWSIAQADGEIDALAQTFAVIAALPGMARERSDITPPVRIHVHRGHLVVYRLEASGVVIIRLLGAGQDWLAILRASEA